MSRKSLMSAVVRIRPDLDGFRSELNKGVEKAASEARADVVDELERAGREGGKAVGDGLSEGVGRGSKEAVKEINALEDRAKKMGKSFGSMQSAGAKMSLSMTAPLVLIGKQSLDAFSQLQDASAAASVFYGDQVQEIEKWSSQSAKSFGVSKRAAYELANGLAPLLQQFTSADKMGTTAVEALGRTADMASFFGGTVDDAAIAVQSFLSGSSVEPIRRFGVFANEAAVAAKAMELGLVQADVSSAKVTAAQARLAAAQSKVNKLAQDGKRGSIDYQKAQADVLLAEEALEKAFEGKIPQLQDAEKIQARYAILMEQTSQAQGDFARTSDSLANSTKATKAQLEDQAAVVGEQLAPHMINLQELLLGVLDKFSSLPKGTQEFIVMAGVVAAVAGPMLTLVGTVGKLGSALIGLAARWTGVTVAANTAAAAQGRAAVAGGAAGAGRFALTGVAGAAGLGVGTAVLAGTAAIAAGYLINKHTGIGDGVGEWIGNLISSDGSENIPGQAEGGVTTRGGLSWVGEKGPELLSLPTGAEVRPLDKVGSTYVTMHVNVTGRAADDPKALARELDKLQRRAAATVGTRRLA